MPYKSTYIKSDVTRVEGSASCIIIVNKLIKFYIIQ